MLIAHCRDDKNYNFLGVVNDLQPADTLLNFVDKAEFKWLERIKVAVGLARLLRFLHCDEPRYLVRDFSTAHIMLDEDWNPVLFNYFMLDAMPSIDRDTDTNRFNYGSWGYIDMAYCYSGEFKWLERIKVAVGLARLLRFLHCDEPRYLVRDFSTAHIMLDEDWNPVLFNYFMVDAMPSIDRDMDTNRFNYGSWGYIDMAYCYSGLWREYTDVFAFGVILCELLFKRKVDHKRYAAHYEYVYLDARKPYPLKKSKFSFKEKKYSFVDESFQKDPDFNALDVPKISKLARLCVDEKVETCRNTKELVRVLEALRVVRNHVEMFTA